MRKKIIISSCLFFLIQSEMIGQTNKSISKDSVVSLEQTLRVVTDLKTGNWQDVLTNFFQLGLSDLTGKNRVFNFKSTLFGLKLKTNPGLNVDTQYVKHSFDRNFQFNISLGIDSTYKLNGFAAGLTWAAINKRDTTLINLIGTKTDAIWSDVYNKLDSKVIKYQTDKLHSGKKKDAADVALAKGIIKKMLLTGKLDVDSLPKDLDVRDEVKMLTNVFALYDSVKNSVLKKALLTFSFNTAFTKQSRFDSLQFGAVYLKGLTNTGKNLELDLRANLNIKDTLINQDHYRVVFTGSGGFNYLLISNNKMGISILEFKPYIEYNRVFKGLLPGENAEKFLANADLRLRITQNIWLPFTIKYDIKKGNFLGFLNVSFNINYFKTQKA